MIVVFTGSHSCGKSSLIERCKDWDSVVCVNSVTRSTITDKERRIDGIKKLDDSQYKILEKIIEFMNDLIEENKKKPNNIYLCDRSVFDFIAYTRAFYKRGLVSDQCLKLIEDTCQNIYTCYDLICYLPIEFPIVDDGVRSLDEQLRTDVDTEICRQLKDKNNVITLSGSYEARLKTLRTVLNNKR